MLELEDGIRDVVRSIHDDLGVPDGYRAEIVGGDIVVSPPPFGRHVFIVSVIREATRQALPAGYSIYENTTLEEPQIDRYIPDLAAWPVSLVRDAVDQWAFAAEDSVFAAEVTSPRHESRDYTKAAGYARGGVPVYLLVDRQACKCVVYTDPSPNGYATQHTVPFGDPVPLTFEGGGEAVIDTSDF